MLGLGGRALEFWWRVVGLGGWFEDVGDATGDAWARVNAMSGWMGWARTVFFFGYWTQGF